MEEAWKKHGRSMEVVHATMVMYSNFNQDATPYKASHPILSQSWGPLGSSISLHGAVFIVVFFCFFVEDLSLVVLSRLCLKSFFTAFKDYTPIETNAPVCPLSQPWVGFVERSPPLEQAEGRGKVDEKFRHRSQKSTSILNNIAHLILTFYII